MSWSSVVGHFNSMRDQLMLVLFLLAYNVLPQHNTPIKFLFWTWFFFGTWFNPTHFQCLFFFSISKENYYFCIRTFLRNIMMWPYHSGRITTNAARITTFVRDNVVWGFHTYITYVCVARNTCSHTSPAQWLSVVACILRVLRDYAEVQILALQRRVLIWWIDGYYNCLCNSIIRQDARHL